MKQLSGLGKALTKNEMKAIKGGWYPCYSGSSSECPNACVTHPTAVKGEICINHECQRLNCPMP